MDIVGSVHLLRVLYHCTVMKLNRHVRHPELTEAQIDRNVQQARHHANEVLRLMPLLSKAQRSHDMPDDHPFSVSMPYVGYAVLYAFDILTAADSLASLPALFELLHGGIEAVEKVARHWASVKRELDIIAARLAEVVAALQDKGSIEGKMAFVVADPIDRTFALEHDLIYSLPRGRYLQATGTLDNHVPLDDALIAVIPP